MEDESRPGEWVWRTEEVHLVNMVVTNLPRLGMDHAICKSEINIHASSATASPSHSAEHQASLPR